MSESLCPCPHCGRRVTYVGFIHVECATRGCPNYAAPPVAATPSKPEGEFSFLEAFDPKLFEGFPTE